MICGTYFQQQALSRILQVPSCGRWQLGLMRIRSLRRFQWLLLYHTLGKKGVASDCHRIKWGQCLLEVVAEYYTRRNPFACCVICLLFEQLEEIFGSYVLVIDSYIFTVIIVNFVTSQNIGMIQQILYYNQFYFSQSTRLLS